MKRQGVRAFLLLAVVGLVTGLSSDMLAEPQSSTVLETDADEVARSDITGGTKFLAMLVSWRYWKWRDKV
jgi:hypothetical protein